MGRKPRFSIDDVLTRKAAGKTVKQIAVELGVTPSAVYAKVRPCSAVLEESADGVDEVAGTDDWEGRWDADKPEQDDESGREEPEIPQSGCVIGGTA